jgi:glycosyltransferase involved in cell wall biosynthesis
LDSAPTIGEKPQRLRPLLIAESCNPEWVSIPLEGWSHSRAIAAMTDAHLVTQIRNRPAILRAGLVEGKDFTAIDSEAAARPAHLLSNLLRGGKGKGWTTATALAAFAYPYFEHLVWKKFASRIHDGEFDVVHRITPLTPTMPSLLAPRVSASGVPYILGPLNGGVPWPEGFDSARRKEREWLSYVRDAYRLLPGYRSTRRSAAAILIGSRDTYRQMPRDFHRKCFYVPENAIDPARFSLVRQKKATRPIRAIFVGRLVPYKGADMLLEAAIPLLKAGKMTLDIIGDGPQMAQLTHLIDEAGVSESVKLVGFVAHEKLQEWLASADVFAFPSIREFGGAVVLEAMAVGVVPIVVDYGGPGELVTESTGYRVPIGPRAGIVARFGQILSDLCEHPEEIDRRSDAARERARKHFTWEAKARSVLDIYWWALYPETKPPRLGMPIPD